MSLHRKCCCGCVTCPEPCNPEDFWPAFYDLAIDPAGLTICAPQCTRGSGFPDEYIKIHDQIADLPEIYRLCLVNVTDSPPAAPVADYCCELPLSRYFDYTVSESLVDFCDTEDAVQDALLFPIMTALWNEGANQTVLQAFLHVRLARNPQLAGSPRWHFFNSLAMNTVGPPGTSSGSAFNSVGGPCAGDGETGRLGFGGACAAVPCTLL